MKPSLKICQNCKMPFEVKDARQKFCNDKCGKKYRNNQEKMAQKRAYERMLLVKNGII